MYAHIYVYIYIYIYICIGAYLATLSPYDYNSKIHVCRYMIHVDSCNDYMNHLKKSKIRYVFDKKTNNMKSM